MKLATCVLSLWICSAADSQEVPTFEEFVVQFEKKYSDADELNYRRSVYIDNVDKIVAHNARGNAVSYRLAVNAFADLTQSEFRAKHLGHVTSAGKLLGASPQFHLGTQAYSGVALPNEVDWTNSTTAVKNQGQSLPRLAEPYGPTPCTNARERPFDWKGYSFCGPPCGANQDCPELTSAIMAAPMCAIKDANNHYCALVCLPGAGGCQTGAECVKVAPMIGVCMFKDAKKYNQSRFLTVTADLINLATAEDDLSVEMVEF